MEFSRTVNDAGNVDAVGSRLIENHVRANDKRAEVLAEILTALAQIGLIREQLQRLDQLIEHFVRGAGLCCPM